MVLVPVDLSKLTDAVNNDVVKKTEYEELVEKVNAIQTTYTSELLKNQLWCKNYQTERKFTDNYHVKYIITQWFFKLMAENSAAR